MGALHGTAAIHHWTATPCRSPSWSISVRVKTSLAMTLCLVSFATSGPSRADELKPFEASYIWVWHGMTVAVSTLQLDQHQDTWVYASKSDPRGMGRMFSERPVQQSTMR